MVITVVEQIVGFIIYLYINFTINKNNWLLILIYFLSYKWGDKVIKTFNELSPK